MTPFSTDQFFNVFEEYNRAIFPFQFGLITVALVAAFIAAKPHWSRTTSLLLAFLWLWMGVVYHLFFFSQINLAAFLFAAMFIFQGALFIYYGVLHQKLVFRLPLNRFGITGALLVLYSLLVYPLLGYGRGATYPAVPTFGLPCPTTIFTLGILLWTRRVIPPLLLVIPAVWSLIGISAVTAFGVMEDLGLPLAAAVSVSMLLFREVSKPLPKFSKILE